VRIDVLRRASQAQVAMEVAMADIDVGGVNVQTEIDVRDRASSVCVLVGMRVDVSAAVTVRVSVHCVGVVVVNGPIRVGSISVILIGRIRVIAMAAVQVIGVGHIPVVVVRRSRAFVVVIAVLHVPVVPVRWLLRRGI